MYALLNPASLLLGLLSWALPLWYCFRADRPEMEARFGWLLAASGGACGLALLCQLAYASHLVAINDWSALLDTADAVVKVSAFLTAATALLNLLAAAVHRAAGTSD